MIEYYDNNRNLDESDVLSEYKTIVIAGIGEYDSIEGGFSIEYEEENPPWYFAMSDRTYERLYNILRHYNDGTVVYIGK